MKDKPYLNLLVEIKELVKNARVKAVSTVNQQLLFLYYEVGKLILERQKQKGLGRKSDRASFKGLILQLSRYEVLLGT